MEDLWFIESAGIEVEEFADIVEYKRFLERFNKDEEKQNRCKLLYDDNNE